MESNLLSVKPRQKCARCTRCLDGSPHIIIYTKNCESIKEVVCYVCNVVEYIDEYKKSGIITTKIMMEASLAKYHFEKESFVNLREEFRELYMQNKSPLLKVANDVEEIGKLVGQFEDKHWLPYLKKYWNETTDRGHVANSQNYTIMMWGSAGRVLITAKENANSITMIFSDYVTTEEDIKKYGNMMTQRGGIQGITATKEKAVAILNELIKMERIEFHPKESVTLAGL